MDWNLAADISVAKGKIKRLAKDFAPGLNPCGQHRRQ